MEVEESCFDDLDRTFLSVSSKFADFFCWTYGMLGYRLVAPLDPNKFDNATTKAKEIAIRSFIVLGAAVSACFAGTYILLTAVVLGAGSKIFRSIGFALQKDGFTHVKGSAPEQPLVNGEAKVMTWNLRGHGGGLHYEYGVVHWSSRIDKIVEGIRSENPDVAVLQECYDTRLAEALIEKLGDKFAHFYIHLGESGCIVITKCAVNRFAHTDFANNDYKTRGFELFEIKADPSDEMPCARFFGTQLTPGKGAQEKRMEQMSQIAKALKKETADLPTFFVGSADDDRDDPERGAYLSQYLHHSYRHDDPTHSDQLASQWAPIFEGQEKRSDFISLFKRNLPDGGTLPVVEKGVGLVDSHLFKAFDLEKIEEALSDHQGVVTTLSLQQAGG